MDINYYIGMAISQLMDSIVRLSPSTRQLKSQMADLIQGRKMYAIRKKVA
jgi:hypothetical protein